MMPGLDGPETLKALRCLPETRNTPAIFMTAKVQLGELARHAADGALGVVAKPFDPVELPSEIRRICGVLVR
jgi:two-component system OmpR family response regulator